MATDYGEKERAFIESLKESSGRDLQEWMAAISAQDLAHRNDVIHWLRQQGFMFSKASWLERIHHNGGRPIYAGAAHGASRPRALHHEKHDSAVQPPLPAAEPPIPADAPPAVSPPPLPAVSEEDLADLLARAKAYRPLAQHVIARIKAVRPTARFLARETFVAIADPAEFAALGIGPKELRLHLALGDHPTGDSLKKGVPGGGLGKGDALSHMLILTDARQVDQRLLELVKAAAANVNG